MDAEIPWRSDSGAPRPPLPGGLQRMFRGGRTLKRWRYVGVFGPELMLCAGQVRVGPGRQSFWAVWDGAALRERTRVWGGHRHVEMSPGELRIEEADFAALVRWEEDEGVETISRHGARGGGGSGGGNGGGVIWTRKQAGAPARGKVRLGSRQLSFSAQVVVDDSAGYHARETAWLWCAGVGHSTAGARLGWNIASGLHDAPQGSERTLWLDGVPQELGPEDFAADLSQVGELRFERQATRYRRERLGPLLQSEYEQPFGRFSGSIGGVLLQEGFGVTERHRAHW
ncbi:MAG: DUF2804 domain-containing protein [Solirubrobacteraceae bacterium]